MSKKQSMLLALTPIWAIPIAVIVDGIFGAPPFIWLFTKILSPIMSVIGPTIKQWWDYWLLDLIS